MKTKTKANSENEKIRYLKTLDILCNPCSIECKNSCFVSVTCKNIHVGMYIDWRYNTLL